MARNARRYRRRASGKGARHQPPRGAQGAAALRGHGTPRRHRRHSRPRRRREALREPHGRRHRRHPRQALHRCLLGHRRGRRPQDHVLRRHDDPRDRTVARDHRISLGDPRRLRRRRTHQVREEAHWRLSTLPAMCAGFRDRGTLVVGAPADIIVYDYDGLTITDTEVVHDLPGGDWRRVQRAHGYRYVLVNGVVTIENDTQTGAPSGQLLRFGAGLPAAEKAGVA
ncbi:MAG: hypothetical protein E6G39_15505 [Actinobacteria bacterium]|nr:MAG: hypothetical protein E6G39_15505 [Actinomycetota bacterium]